ncbi:MAG TPA: glycosyltransferase family 4 protein [Tepidisphaeraceae bacterium]|jgi:glycosyltransferase involved in cell wall biosynthesis|nr:glycosyltransferase family 4 protein [Tepidisphaeraceae bacterium]
MMKVLMTADAVGGVWTYALELCRALADYEVEVILAVMGPAPTLSQRSDAAALGNVALHVRTYALEWMPQPWDDVRRAGEWLLNLERAESPDVIHLNGYVHAALPWRAPKLVVGHSCVLSWWRAVKGEPAPAEWAVYRSAVARGLHAAQAVVAPSRAMLESLHQHYGHLPRARVIPNGRTAALFRSGMKEQFVLSAGRVWDEAKNIAVLTKAADEIPWPVRVAGKADGDLDSQRMGGRVEFFGHLDAAALSDQMSRAAIYALPARYEPFGLSALEAALSGCALVLGDIPSLREVWADAATFVPPEDEKAIAAAIRRLIQEPALRSEMSLRASAHAARYTPARMACGYFGMYRELCGSAASALGESLAIQEG